MALNLGEGFVLVGAKNLLGGQMRQIGASFQASMNAMNAMARRAKIALALGAGGLILASRAAANFEQGMARVRALTGATGESFDALRQQAIDLGRTTMFSARQSADAMGFFALAGFDAQTIMAAMPHTLDLAAAGMIDISSAADITAKIMAGMGLSTDELGGAVDVMAKAMTTANTDLVQLGEAMKFVGPVARAAGKSLEEMVAVIQVLSNAGIQGGMAGAALRNVLIRLANPPKDAADAFRRLNVSITDSANNIRPLADIIDDLNDSLRDMSDAQKLSTAAQIAGLRSAAAFATLLEEGGDRVRDMEAALQDAGGTAKRIADIQMDTLQGAITKLKSAAEGLAITIGDKLNPHIRALVELITAWTASMANATDAEIQNTLATIEMAAKILLLVVAASSLLNMMSSIGILMMAGGPLALAIIGVTIAISALILVMAEAEIKGQSFNDTMLDNAEAMGFLERGAASAKLAIDRLNKSVATEARATRKEVAEAEKEGDDQKLLDINLKRIERAGEAIKDANKEINRGSRFLVENRQQAEGRGKERRDLLAPSSFGAVGQVIERRQRREAAEAVAKARQTVAEQEKLIKATERRLFELLADTIEVTPREFVANEVTNQLSSAFQLGMDPLNALAKLVTDITRQKPPSEFGDQLPPQKAGPGTEGIFSPAKPGGAAGSGLGPAATATLGPFGPFGLAFPLQMAMIQAQAQVARMPEVRGARTVGLEQIGNTVAASLRTDKDKALKQAFKRFLDQMMKAPKNLENIDEQTKDLTPKAQPG